MTGYLTTGDLLLERNSLVTRFGAVDPRDRVLGRLHELVSRRGPFDDDGIGWLEDLVDWVGERGRVAARQPDEEETVARVRVLVEALEEIPSFQAELRGVVARTLEACSSTQLFTGTGLPTRPGFWGELVDRAARQVLPEPPVEKQLARVCARLFGKRSLARAWVYLPEALRARLMLAIGFDEGLVTTQLLPGLREAALVLAARLAALGTSDDVVMLEFGGEVKTSPFLGLIDETNAFLQNTTKTVLRGRIEACQAVEARARAGLETRGISVDLVFRLQLIEASLQRFALVVAVIAGDRGEQAFTLARDVVLGSAEDRSILALLRSGTQLLARRVVERAGHSGEHYVTRSRVEQRAMLAAAAGGGAVTAFVVWAKFFVAHVGLAPLWLALAISLNYSWGFVLMQALHFALATKQPSMTAATIAGAIENGKVGGTVTLEPVVDLVKRASRTQFTALVGNVVMVVPLAVGIDAVRTLLTGHHVLDHAGALSVISNHQPFTSLTLLYAATTGIWLWAASLVAGGVENWFIVREMPGAISSNRLLRRVIGPVRAQAMAQRFQEQINGLGGNVGFGMLLGFMPMLIGLFGVPIEVRHVTFVAGQLAFAAMELGPMALTRADVLAVVVVVPLVGLINFAVSFLLALVVALRARGLGNRWLVRLARAVVAELWRAPKAFFLAPKE